MKKDYLEIYVGERGMVESIGRVSIVGIEQYLDGEVGVNLEQVGEGCIDRDLLWGWKKGKGEVYMLGLGEGEVKYFIGMEEELTKGLGDREWSSMSDDEVWELLEGLGF